MSRKQPDRTELGAGRYDVTIYLADGRVEHHQGVSETRATELEGVFGASEDVMRIDVVQR